MRIGIVTAMASETLPIYQKLGNVTAQSTISGVYIRKIEIDGNTVYLATSGVGEIRAALAAQLLKDLFDVEAMLNFGFVGALDPALRVGELVLVDRVCHYQFDTSAIDGTMPGQYPECNDRFFRLDGSLIDRVLEAVGKPMRVVAAASGDVFVADGKTKRVLHKDFGCGICEMELAGLAIACQRNRIPLLSVKVVSDRADEGATESFSTIVTKGLSRYESLLPDVLAAITGNVSPLPPIKP